MITVKRLNECKQKKNEIQIPKFKELLRIDSSKDHPIHKGVKGAAGLYFVEGQTDAGVKEIETAQRSPLDPNKLAAHQADHFIDNCKYFASDNPCYMGDAALWQINDEGVHVPTEYTGY